jgi:hypothetical protein
LNDHWSADADLENIVDSVVQVKTAVVAKAVGGVVKEVVLVLGEEGII